MTKVDIGKIIKGKMGSGSLEYLVKLPDDNTINIQSTLILPQKEEE